jgi:hypothetical protein
VRRERKMALKLSRLIEEKCKLLDKISLSPKQHDDIVSPLKDETKFYRKFMVKDHCQKDIEKKFSKAEVKIMHMLTELETY